MNFYLCISVSFVLAVALAKPIIKFLSGIKSIQSFRELGPKSHIKEKSGTPTMGAWIFLIPIFLLGILLYLQFQSQAIGLVLIALFVGAVMGALDDGLKILQSNYKGLNGKQKLLIQFLTSSLIVFLSGRYLFADINPLLPEWTNSFMLYWEYVWAFLVIAGSSNAINLSDGLDGLATGLCILAFAALGILLWSRGDFALMCFCAVIVAALAGFLIFNFKPAKIFMGDTGSLALGMGLGALAYIANIEYYLLVFALVPVLETLSVMLQVASSQLSKRFLGRDIRIFKMAPLHHHFELSGFKELTVVFGFWAVQLVVSVIVIATFSIH